MLSLRGYVRVWSINFRVQVVMLVMLVKPADTSPREHLLSDRSSNVFKHLQSSEFCRASCTPDCFEILDSAATKYQVKLKESMFIKWEKPDLNQQVKHINLTLSL